MFSCAANAATLKVLHEFGGTDGSDPTGGLVVDSNTGTLYGTTKYGGSGNGTVFSLSPPAPGKTRWKHQVLHDFNGSNDGSQPETGLSILRSDNLYLIGTTRYGSFSCGGCGEIFAVYKPSDSKEWKKFEVQEFHGDATDGIVPNSTPVVGSDGDLLYGTTGSIGGSAGTIYRVSFFTANLEVIYNPAQGKGTFVGYHPQGVVVEDSTILGTAFDGAYSGTIFGMDVTGVGSVAHGFSGPDGQGPEAPPILAPDGSLYGTTVQGGNPKDCPNSPGCGTVWKLTAGGRFKTLHSFRFFTHPKDGMAPISPLVLDATTGTLYGTTSAGGTGTNCGGTGGSCGTVFEIDSTGNYQVLWEFPKGGPANPQGQLVFYAGDLYGTSYDGGKPCPDQHYIGCGTVWRLTP
jgi:uncharacterized repeat protein (TIGR03803 family)